MIDRLGTRLGYALAITVWSLAAMAHAVANSALTFGIARALLGLGEAANFPACIKTVAEWFPKKERALATGLFNSGANIGAVFAPLIVPWLATHYGWPSAFIVTGAIGFVWLVAWWFDLPEPGRTSASVGARAGATSAAIRPIPRVRCRGWCCSRRKQTWAFAVGQGTDRPDLVVLPVLAAEVFAGSVSSDAHTNHACRVLVVYNVSSVGSIAGGWLSGMLIKRGKTVNVARKTAMLTCALAVLPVLYAPYCKSLWVVVGLVGLATAAHQGWSANLFTTASDMFPRAAVGSVVGIGGTAGAAAGVLVTIATGKIVQDMHTYLPTFLFAATGYLLALAVIQSLSPHLEQADLKNA